MRKNSVIAFIGVLCLLGACTYSGKVDPSFYQAAPRNDLDGGKIPLSAAVVRSPQLEKLSFKASANGYSVYIPLGEPLARAIELELGTIFQKAGAVEDAKAGGYDLYVYPEIKWVETYRNRMSGQLEYLVRLRTALRDEERQFTLQIFETKTKASYSPPAEAVGAQILTGASLYILSPLTVPLTTQAVGSEAKEVVGATIADLVKEFGNATVTEGIARDYATLRRDQRQTMLAAAPPAVRPKSKYDDLLDAVVTIATASSAGSGFFISGDGLIVTNKHVIDNEKTVAVKMRNGSVSLGQIVATNAVKDLALVRVKGNGFPYLKLSGGEHAGIGNDVIAIGTPKGLGWSVARGIISAVRTEPDARYIQTDTAINQGNSGGPLIDLASGYVVGVNTLGFRKDIAEGLNFAVSSQDVLTTFAATIGQTTGVR